MDERGKKLVRLWLNLSNRDHPFANFSDLERFCLFLKYVANLDAVDILSEVDKALREKIESENHRVEIWSQASTYIHFYQTMLQLGPLEKYYRPEAYS